jgi:putative transcriptional regulator
MLMMSMLMAVNGLLPLGNLSPIRYNITGGINRMLENRIGALLKIHGRSITDMARATGLAYDSAWNLAAGRVKRIELNTIEKLCEFFNCQPGQLFVYTPPAAPELADLEQMLADLMRDQ